MHNHGKNLSRLKIEARLQLNVPKHELTCRHFVHFKYPACFHYEVLVLEQSIVYARLSQLRQMSRGDLFVPGKLPRSTKDICSITISTVCGCILLHVITHSDLEKIKSSLLLTIEHKSFTFGRLSYFIGL